MKKNVIGAWALESFVIENPEGESRNWGTNTSGLLIYTESGHMSVSINKNVENKSTVEAQNFFDSILFYSGTFVIDGTTIIHKVSQASNPSRIGKELRRSATLEGSLLLLVSPTESFGRALLKWKKIA